MLRPTLVALAFATAPVHAQMPEPLGKAAAVGEWIETDGARVRVLLGSVSADGTVDGVVEIDLEPGWKTYWIAPGPNGIAPQFEAARSDNLDLLAVAHPAPERFADGFGTSVGYRGDVAFPLFLALRDPVGPARLRLDGFIGVCEAICVPLPIAVEGDVPVGQSGPADATIPIGRARMGLPLDGPDGALTGRIVDGALTITGVPEGAEAFVAPPTGLVLGEGTRDGDAWRASIRRGEPVGDLTVVVRDGAIETIHRVPLGG